MPEEELYNRQTQLSLNIPESVTVAGCGGIGSWVAILSAMSGVKNLYLFDPDIMEESNRNRLPFCQGSLGKPKVEVIKDYILVIRPEANVVAVPEKLEGIFLSIQTTLSNFIIDCTDNPRAQYSIYNTCKRNGTAYVRAGYDGTHIMVTSNVSGWVKTDTEEETYRVNPSWVVPAVTVAALAVGKMMKYPAQEVGLDLSEIGIPILQKKSKITARCRQDGGSR